MDNDIEQGMPRCDKCFEVLPCHDHPAPPKLSIINGGCNISGCVLCESPSHKPEPPPEMVKVETPVGLIEYRKEDEPFIQSGLDTSDWPLRDNPFSTIETTVHTDWPNLDCHFPDTDTDGTAIPEYTRVSEIPEQEKSNIVNFPGETVLDVKPEFVCEEALKKKPGLLVVMGYDENGDEFFLWSSADSHTNNFLLDRAKMAIMEAYDGDED